MCSVANWRSMKAVGEYDQVGYHLQEGIKSICDISMALIDAHVDNNTSMCSNYEQIRKHIENAEKCLKTSENIIKEKLGNLDKSMEHSIKEKYRVEQEREEKRMIIQKLFKDKACAEETLHNWKRAEQEAERNLASQKQALTKEIIRDGYDMRIFYPLHGYFSGPKMTEIRGFWQNEALRTIRAIEEEIRNDESKVREYRGKVSDCENKISQAKQEIKKTKEELKNIQEEIEELMKHLVVTAEIQNTVRRVVHLVSVLSGRVTVLEKQTQRFILWEPVMNVTKEVMMAAINIAENQFLYSQGLPGLINTLKENSARLLAVPKLPDSTEHERYF